MKGAAPPIHASLGPNKPLFGKGGLGDFPRTFEEVKEDRIILGSHQEVTEEIHNCQDELGAKYWFRLY